MIKSIQIKVIPHNEQRYPTVGDYVEMTPGDWVIFVSNTGDWRMDMLVGLHELVELMLTQNDGIAEPIIKEFDEEWEKNKKDPDAEPGAQPGAPYHWQHIFAENVERMMAAQLEVEWDHYEGVINEIWRRK